MIDFHSHILPNMDDGSTSIDVSLNLLNTLEKQSVNTLCLTSHYYPSEEDVKAYLKRRDDAYDNLIKEYKGPIKLIKGAEVYYYSGISYLDNLYDLCLEGSDFLLIELPYDKRINFSELYSLNTKISVVLAHIERYLDLYSIKEIEELVNNGIYLQVNAEVFDKHEFKQIKKLFEKDMISFIGSDAHNIEDRAPEFNKFKDFVLDNYGQMYYDKYIEKVEKTFKERFK